MIKTAQPKSPRPIFMPLGTGGRPFGFFADRSGRCSAIFTFLGSLLLPGAIGGPTARVQRYCRYAHRHLKVDCRPVSNDKKTPLQREQAPASGSRRLERENRLPVGLQ